MTPARTPQRRDRVGLIGLGVMGTAMAERLASGGLLACVHNRTAHKAEVAASRLGVVLCATPADLAEASDFVITVVSDEDALRAVYEDENGLLSALRPGSLCLEMSTVGPQVIQELGRALEGHHCELVDAPVSGSVEMATTGDLTILAGGAPTAIERARPLFDRLASRTFHLGPAGSGAVMKLAVNNVIYGLSQSLAESLVLAELAGVERLVAYEVFASSAIAAPFVQYRRRLFEEPSSESPQMTMSLAMKDLRLISDLANAVGAPLPQGATNRAVLAEAIAAGWERSDVTAVAAYLRGMHVHGDTPKENHNG